MSFLHWPNAIAESLIDPYYTCFLLCSTVFFLFYRLRVVGPVELVCKKDANWHFWLCENMPILQEQFWPTFWCFESHMQTYSGSIIRLFLPEVKYRREILCLEDGGEIGLDWHDPKNSQKINTEDDNSYEGPILIVLPGLTGHSQSDYIKKFVQIAAKEVGAKCVVLNYRGRGGTRLKTARTYCGAKSDDVRHCIDTLRKRYPDSQILALGISFGGILLTNYLTHEGERAREKLVAAMTMSSCFDTFKATESLERLGMNRVLNRLLAYALVDTIKDETHHFENHVDLDLVLASKTIREFDSHFTCRVFSYSDVNEYYRDVMLAGKLNRVRIPLLALNAADDPIQPGDSIPRGEASRTDKVAIAITKYGGHIGFLEGLWPTGDHFSDRFFRQFIRGVFKDVHKISHL